ncbi:MAG TPA: hypothetical protein VF834_16245 [Streptosporangiaceae bacterium]
MGGAGRYLTTPHANGTHEGSPDVREGSTTDKAPIRERAGGRPVSRRVQARVMRIANVPMRVALGLPFATPLSSRLMLAYITGRTSGRTYRVPLSQVSHDGALLTPGGGRWTANLADGKPVRLRLRGKDLAARPELVTDPGEVARLLTIMVAANPAMTRFIGIGRDRTGELDQAEVARAVGYGFVIVRWHPEQS